MAEKDLSAGVETLSLSDDSITDITVCSWNIMGNAKVQYRKSFTTATFEHQFASGASSGTTSLGQADIICVQEMDFASGGKKESEYLPFVSSTHALGGGQVENEGKENAVYYKKEKFVGLIIKPDPIEQAFTLMEHKKDVYDKIAKGGDEKIKKALQGKLSPEDFEPWCDSSDKRKMCEEVLGECKDAGTPAANFHQRRNRFIGPKASETQSPERLLKHRMGICCLRVKSVRECIFVAASVHNYSTRSGKEAPGRFADLLFDFLEKLEVPALIAGDFNLDITKLRPLIDKYKRKNWIKCDYEMKDLRRGQERIDFILMHGRADNLDFEIISTEAHDLQVPPAIAEELKREKKYITNHNPLSSTIRVKNKK